MGDVINLNIRYIHRMEEEGLWRKRDCGGEGVSREQEANMWWVDASVREPGAPSECEGSGMGRTKIVKKEKMVRHKAGEVRKMWAYFWTVSGILPKDNEKPPINCT